MTEDDFEQIGAWADSGPDVVAAVIEDDLGRFCLQLRDDFEGVEFAGYWCLFGGHIDPGEDPATAMLRELVEETGLQLSMADITPDIRTLSETGKRFFVFRITAKITPEMIRVGEGAGFAFMTPAQIETLHLIPTCRVILDHHVARRAGNRS